jgi:hypothetical protein
MAVKSVEIPMATTFRPLRRKNYNKSHGERKKIKKFYAINSAFRSGKKLLLTFMKLIFVLSTFRAAILYKMRKKYAR